MQNLVGLPGTLYFGHFNDFLNRHDGYVWIAMENTVRKPDNRRHRYWDCASIPLLNGKPNLDELIVYHIVDCRSFVSKHGLKNIGKRGVFYFRRDIVKPFILVQFSQTRHHIKLLYGKNAEQRNSKHPDILSKHIQALRRLKYVVSITFDPFFRELERPNFYKWVLHSALSRIGQY
jgi:hypothetical protein